MAAKCSPFEGEKKSPNEPGAYRSDSRWHSAGFRNEWKFVISLCAADDK